MFGVLADHHDLTVTLDDLALFTDFLDRRFYFHSPYHLSLFCTPCYTSLGRIVNRDLDGDFVSDKNPDIIHSELSGYVSRNYHIIRKLDLEGRVRQHFDYHAFKLYNVILWQNNPSLIIFKRYF